jgi:hypothetical protein
MKNSAQILSHLQHQPQFSKLSQYECIKSVQKLFPPHLQRMIRYGYIRNQTLFFVFTHPGAKQEFDIIAESIRRPLKEHPPASCRDCSFDTIKGFVSHRPPAAVLAAVKKQQLHYKERAAGRFSNPVSNEKLHAMIEKIRTIIHARTDQIPS